MFRLSLIVTFSSFSVSFQNLKTTSDFHITLQFLGEGIDETALSQINEVLSSISFSPFEIEMGDIMPFGNPKNPRGIWMECKMNPDLQTLSNVVREVMSGLGYGPDHPFKPHITLGRYKNLPSIPPKTIKAERHTFKVDRFCLMRSELAPSGPTYTVLQCVNSDV